MWAKISKDIDSGVKLIEVCVKNICFYKCATSVCYLSPVVLIMLLGVAVAAAKMLGVLPGVAAPLVVGVPTVLTDRLPGGGFLTGTITLL